jgi:hypothetical protein
MSPYTSEEAIRKMQRERKAKRTPRPHRSSAGLDSPNPGFGGLRATRVPRRGKRKSDAGLQGYSNGGGS